MSGCSRVAETERTQPVAVWVAPGPWVLLTSVERYVIRGGRQGYDRLLVLSRDHWLNTSALLSQAQMIPGMNCVDLGCGGGEVTLEIARLVGPDGTVKGIDMDPVKLDLGRQAAMDRGITNVRFENLNVNEWDEHDSYDAVYSRFLLHHLGRPFDLVERMWNAVRAGGSSSSRMQITTVGIATLRTKASSSLCEVSNKYSISLVETTLLGESSTDASLRPGFQIQRSGSSNRRESLAKPRTWPG